MPTRVQRWGSSLAVRIPKPLAERIGLRPGALVDLEAEGGALRVRPAEYTLDGLLNAVTDENLHREVDTGGSAGGEAW